MTLKELIDKLEHYDTSHNVAKGFGNPHSYRGYYDQLAFEPVDNTTVGEMLTCARNALGETYTGWKGGEFTMYEHTDVYLAHQGQGGEEIGPMLLSYMLGEI